MGDVAGERGDRSRITFASTEANDVGRALQLSCIRRSGPPPFRGWPEPGPFVGRDAALAEVERLIEWGEIRFTDIDVVADEGDWVVVAYRWHVRGAGSGIETHLDVAVGRSGERGPHHRVAQPLEPRRSPRSRRAAGVGDVAGERRGHQRPLFAAVNEV